MTNFQQTDGEKYSFDSCLDQLMIEIFDYLSNNDVIYAFFVFNVRLNRFLLENSNYFEMPTKDLKQWILSVMGSYISIFHINSMNCAFPLTYFPNIKSIVISSTFGLSNKQLQSIIESEQFYEIRSLTL